MVRLKDISAAAGVSTRTVARALKDEGRVAPAVKARIQRLAHEMAYRPDPLALALRTGRSTEILVLLCQMQELQMRRVAALGEELGRHGYGMRIAHVAADAAALRRTVRQLAQSRLAGLVLDSHYARELPPEAIAPLHDLDVPIVRLNSMTRDVVGSYVDRERGIRDGVAYLHAIGHRRIAYLGLLHDPSRVNGYLRACSDLAVTPVFLPFADAPDRFVAARTAAAGYLDMAPRPTAVQAHSDEIALGFLSGLHDCGVAVPGEVAVVGFDDRQAAACSWPPLTTLAQPTQAMGEATARVLLARIAGDGPPPGGWCQVLTPRLVVREST